MKWKPRTLTEAIRKTLEAFEIWCYRLMLRIPYIHHAMNAKGSGDTAMY